VAISETISIDAGPAIGALDALGAAAEEAAAKFAAAMDKLKVPSVGGGGADKLAASMDAAAASIDEAVGKIQAAFDKLAGMGDSAAAGLEKIGEAADSAAGPLEAIAGAADEAAAANDRLAESADAAGGALDRTAVAGERAGAAADDAAAGAAAGAESHSKLGEYALGAAVVIGYATDKAMKFNAQIVTLNTQAGVSKNQLGALSKGVLELAGQVGQSPGNLADSLYHVASNMESMPGTTTAKMLDAVRVAAEGAAVGHSDLVDTTNALTSVLASGIPGAKDYTQAMGAINATVGAGDMTMQDLSEAMGTGVVPVVKGYGLTLKDVGAALATYGDLNIRGAKAGTELRMAVQALAVPASTATAELGKLGLTTTSLSKDMESGGLNKALLDLNQRFKDNGITAKDEGAVITDLFGKKAGAGLALLLENMDRVESKYPALTKGADDFGQAWATTQQTAQQKLKQLESGAQAMAITLGNIALPTADKIMGGLDRAMEYVQSHSFASKGLTLGLGTLIAGGLTKGIFSGVEAGLSGIGKLGSLLNIPGMDKLAGIGQGSGLSGAASGLSGAAGSLDGAAGALEGAAASLKGTAATGGVAGTEGAATRAGSGEAAAAGAAAAGTEAEAAEAAGAGGFMTKLIGGGGLMAGIRAAGGTVALGLTIGEVTKAVGDKLAPAGTTAGSLNQALQKTPGTNDSSLMPYLFGGFESKIGSEIGLSVGKAVGTVFGQQGPAGTSGTQQVAAEGGVASRLAGAAPAPVKIPAPDTSALDAAKGKVQSDIAGLGGHPTPIRLPAPDLGALTAAKGQVQSDIAGLGGHPTPIRLPSPDLSALVAAKGAAAAAGASVGQGFAAGIAGEAGAVTAAAGALAADAAAAMSHVLISHSPSEVTKKIGQDFDAGFTAGIAGNSDSVAAASAEIGSASVASLLQGLAGGQSNIQNAIQAVMGAAANPDAVTSIQQTIQTLIGDVPAKDTGLVKWLTGQQSKLSALANQQGAIMAQITNAQQLATSAISGAGITSAVGYTPALAAANGPQASQSIITGMQQQLADTKSFASTLAQLQKEGLNATSLSQLAQAGTATGLPLAEGLQQGGKGAVAQLNQIESQIIKASQSIGSTGGTAMYNASQQVMKGLDAPLKAELTAIDKDMSKIADSIISTVQKKLGTKAASSSAASGSTAATAAAAASAVSGAASAGSLGPAATAAASGLGKVGPAGGAAATGLDSVASAAGAAAAGLGKISAAIAPLLAASQPSPGGGHAQPMGGGGYSAQMSGGGGNVTHVHNYNIQGSLIHQDNFADLVQQAVLSKGSQNWQMGNTYAGRAQ
jgi:TP901 family phage tail tape measure protein